MRYYKSPPNYVVEDHHSAKASRGEDLEIEEPVSCRDSSAFHFHTTLPGMLGPTLIRDEVVQMGEPREKRLLAPTWMMEALHREQFPLDGVMGLIQQRAGHGHLGVCEDRIPARLLLLEPAPDTLAVGVPRAVCHVVGKVAEPLAQRKHPQAFALACPVQQGVELGAQGLAHRRRDRHQFGGQLIERVAETVAEACSREQRPHTARRAVKAIGQDAADPIRRLLLERRLLKRSI